VLPWRLAFFAGDGPGSGDSPPMCAECPLLPEHEPDYPVPGGVAGTPLVGDSPRARSVRRGGVPLGDVPEAQVIPRVAAGLGLSRTVVSFSGA
jgi:uracil-DNA glycosylase